jgi:RNA polymerase sigma-70 factor (ECF subfamily)
MRKIVHNERKPSLPLYDKKVLPMESLEHVNDERMVTLVREKDQELYAEIVRRYEAKLLRYAMSIIKDEHRSQDIVQNAFIKAFINLQSFNVKMKFSSWIYRITHNEAINEIKKYRKEVRLDDIPEIENIPSDETKADELFDSNLIRDMLKSSLDSLPMSYREPLYLYYFEERSYQEISDILRMPMGTVATRINRGKSLLKKNYKQLHPNNQPYGQPA